MERNCARGAEGLAANYWAPARTPALALVLILAVVRCGGSGGTGPGTGGTGACTTGNEGCDCYGNGTCNGSLACRSQLCVSLTGSAGATGSAGTGGGTAGNAGTAGTGGGVACANPGDLCASIPCCVGAVCVNDGTRAICAANCQRGTDCASGCCAALQSGGSACGPPSLCTPPDPCASFVACVINNPIPGSSPSAACAIADGKTSTVEACMAGCPGGDCGQCTRGTA